MKIFYLARINTAIEDANTRHVFEFCRQFVSMGHEVVLFVPDLGGRRKLEGVRTVYIPVGIKKKSATYLLFYLFLSFFLPFYFIRDKPQIIYTRHQQMEWVTTWWKWIFRFSYVIESNGLTPVELKILSAPGWWIKVVECMEWFCFRMPDLIVTSSPQIKDVLCGKYGLNPEKFLVVSNGANPDVFKPLNLKDCRKRLQLDLDGKYLVFVGSLWRWNGLEQIVLSMVPLGKKFPDLRLLLVGGGEELDNFKKLVSKNQLSDRIFLTGQQPSHEIPYYINAADVCLASYVKKPGLSPFKVFEYMACGKPVICNAVGGVDVLFNEHKVGKLVRSQDPGDWAECIEEMLNNPEQMAVYGKNGLTAVLNEFNWEAICKKIENSLERLVSSK